jgi:hypothetical protein
MVKMAVTRTTNQAKERKLKGGGVRPPYSFDAVKVETGENYSAENFLSDALEISGGNLVTAAEILAEGFNAISERKANPMKDPLVKAILDAAKAKGKEISVSDAQALAASLIS